MLEKKFENKTISEKMYSYFRKHSTILLLSLLSFSATQSVAQSETPLSIETVSTKDSLNEAIIHAYKADFASFEQIIQQRGIEEKLDSLKNLYGNAIDNFLSIHSISQDIQNFHKVQSRKDINTIFVNGDSRFTTPGSMLSKAYKSRWLEQNIENHEISYQNIEAVDGLSAQQVKDYLLLKFPKGYSENAISEVEFVPTVNQAEGGIIKIGEAEVFDFQSMLADTDGDSRKKVQIFDVPQGIDAKIFFDILDHEVQHPNDWNNSTVLTSADRVEMLFDFSERMQSQDRYKSSYVEGITLDQLDARFTDPKILELPKDEKVKIILYVRTTEYFAEVTKAYFNDPATLKTNHPNDYTIVNKWVERINDLNNK